MATQPAELIQGFVSVAAAAAALTPNDDEWITFISGTWMGRAAEAADPKGRRKLALQAMLARGWPVRHLWCGSDKPRFEEWIIDFLGFHGTYELTRVKRRTPSYDLLHIPRVGGYIAFVGTQSDQLRAWFTAEGSVALSQVVRDAANHAWATCVLDEWTQVLLFEGQDEIAPGITSAELELEEHASLVEGRQGERVSLKDGLSNCTQPMSIAAELRKRHTVMARTSLEQAAVDRFYTARERRIDHFDRLLREGRIRALCTLDAVSNFMLTGRWEGERSNPIGPQLAMAERVQWIRHLIDRIRNHSSTFQLALIDESTHLRDLRGLDIRPLLRRAQWDAIGETHLLFEVAEAVGAGPGASGRSSTADVVAAFRSIFDDIWDLLPSRVYEPTRVMRQLKDLIKKSDTEASPSGP